MPQFGWPQSTKPGRGALIGPTRPLARGLMGFYAMGEGAGGTLYDATGNLPLALAGYGAANPWVGSQAGSAVQLIGAAYGASASIPAPLQVSYPISVAFAYQLPQAGFGSFAASLFGLANNASGFTFSTGICYLYAGGSTVAVAYHNNFGYTSLAATPAVNTLGLHVISATIAPGAQAIYTDGVPGGSSGAALSGQPPYSSPLVLLGNGGLFTQELPNIYAIWGGWWNRALSAAEHAAIGASPNAIWPLFAPGPLRSWVFFQGSGAMLGQSSGGLVSGGYLAPSVTFSPPAAGGAIAGGSARPSAIFSGTSAGGAIAGGSAAPSASFSPAVAGGIVAGGSAQGSIPGATTGLWYRRHARKVHRGGMIDPMYPLSRVLSLFAPLNEGAGPPSDLAARLAFTLQGSAAWVPGPSSMALSCVGSGAGAYAILPPSLQFASYPVTIACGYVYTGGTPTANANIFGLVSTTSGSGVVNNARITWDSGGVAIGLSSSGYAASGGYVPTAGAETVLALTIPAGNTAPLLYAAGKLVFTGSAPGSAPSWSATSNASIGQIPGLSARTPQGYVTWAAAWPRALSAAEHAQLAINPWQMLRPQLVIATGGAPSFAGSSSGGAVAGGAALPSAAFSGQSSGGAVAGGSAQATSTTIFTASASGGVVLGGLAAPSVVFSRASGGGAVLGGSAQGSTSGVFAGQSSGGAVVGGLAAPSASFVAHAAGGPVAGGSAQGLIPIVTTWAIACWQGAEVIATDAYSLGGGAEVIATDAFSLTPGAEVLE